MHRRRDMALRPISRIDDYAFPADAWDVRGWTVRTEVGDDKVGKVDDMLLDGSGSLRYLDVDLGFLKKHVLVPLEHAHADRESETVRIEGVSKERLESVPEYALDPESLDQGHEHRLAAVYGGAARSGAGGVRGASIEPWPDDDSELDLRRMDALEDDYRVAGEDPRGWDVVTADGKKVGEVAELLMDPGAMKARFLDVAVAEKKLELEPVDRHILLPSERVRLERAKKRVVVGGLFAGDVATYPQYGGLPVRSRTARELDSLFERVGSDEATRHQAGVEPGDEPARDTALGHFYRPSGGAPRGPVEGGYHG
jgi:ribosomal 30S subunit maturation factor RimM